MAEILDYKHIGNIIHTKIIAENVFTKEQVDAIKSKVYELVENNKRIQFLLDLSNVQDISSPFIAFLLDIKLKIDENDGTFKLANLQHKLSEMIELTQLNKSLDIYSSSEKALISFSHDIFNKINSD